MIRKLFAALSGLFGDKPVKPMAVRPTRQIEDWRIAYTRDGRYFIQGWLNGAYMTSDFIKRIDPERVIVDVMGNRFSLGKADGGEWSYSLRIRWPQGWQWFHDAGVIQNFH